MTHHYLGPLEIDEDLGAMSRYRLRKRFSSRARPGRVVATRLLRSIILQIRRERAADPERFTGNLRMLWHDLPEQILSRLTASERGKDPYHNLSRTLSDMVLDHKLLRYADLDLTDPNWEDRRIGGRRPEIVLMAEKRGWFRLLREVHTAEGVTVCTIGGFASAISVEYTAQYVKEAISDLGREHIEPRLIAIVDYNPHGWEIARSFRRELAKAGLECGEPSFLVKPIHVPQEDLAWSAIPIGTPAKKHRERTDRWLSKTRGIAGRREGLETEAIPYDKLLAVALAAVRDA